MKKTKCQRHIFVLLVDRFIKNKPEEEIMLKFTDASGIQPFCGMGKLSAYLNKLNIQICCL